MADQYHDLTGESAYMGESEGTHLFVDGNIRGNDAAREHSATTIPALSASASGIGDHEGDQDGHEPDAVAQVGQLNN